MLKLLKKYLNKEYVLTEDENLIHDIVIKLIESDGTDVIVAPISQNYYISNCELAYYIKICEFSISITNHKFSFNQQLTSKFSNKLIHIVKEYMEKNRKEFEDRVFNNQIELLKKIKDSL